GKMAAALERSFIEICGFERETLNRFREVTVNLGGLSALPGGVKFPDSAGAFHYEDSGKLLSVTSNRFIHWSTSGDTVQLVEQSLDTNLLNNGVKLKFSHCTVLPGGVSIQETLNNVVILICTNQSVHRLVLAHPTRMYRSDFVTELHMQSVFTDVGKQSLQDPSSSAVIPGFVGQMGSPITSTAWLSQSGEGHYALASPAGGILIVTLPPHDAQGDVSVLELKRNSMMQRLSGWMPTAIRGEHSPCDLVLSLAVPCEEDCFIFALCQDHKMRMWSLREQACLLEADMLEYMPACKGVRRLVGQGHRLRLAFSSTTGLCLCVYLAVPQRGQFTVLQLVATDNRYSFDHISSLFTTQETLVDFVLTSSDIWGVWVDDSNTTVVKYINFEHNTAGQNQVFVQPPPEEEVHIGVEQDPRETYLDVLFSPLRFTASAIVKALQIFRRGSDRVSDLSWEALKKEVTVAVESESCSCRAASTEFEFSQEEYRQLQVEFWSKFYACCLQYQEALSMPLGLTVSPHTNMVCVLKKGFVSFLLPCFAVDHLYLSYDEYLLSEEDTPISEDPEVGRDVLQLVQCLRLLSEAVSPELAYEMEKALEHLQSPERAAELILDNLLSDDSDNVIEEIQNKLQDVRNPMAAMMVLLREMDLETDSEFGAEGAVGPGLNARIHLSQLYGSSSAVSLICQAVCHMSMTRELFCRDLLILQKLYLRFGDNVFLGGGSQLLQLQDLVPRSSHMLTSYHLLKHVSQSLASSVPVDVIDANLQHLSVLQLSDSPALSAHRSALSPQTVVELFYQTGARKSIVGQIYGQQQSPSLLHWSHMMSAVVHLLAQLLWPSNPGFQFPECLMTNCQYTQLQEYIRLIGPWCQTNIGSCRFMLAQCYLANGEGQKALQCFQEAATEVEKEEFLIRLTGSEEEEAAAASPRLQYFNKVLRLLEDVGLPELVIQLASLAITEAVNDVNSQAALWTRIFKHHLDLGHNGAYEALTQNPDSSMQLDCLRQLVVVLCERAQLKDLVQFPYVDLHDEVVGIIESRARGLDLLAHNYYELLYAFHVNRHNYRKAGTVMYEFGMRLGREVRTRLGLQKQVNCYLAALNCLRLIRPEYAWIVQPAFGAMYERPGASPKRNSDGEFSSEPVVRRQVDILELKDLEKEYILSRSRLTLAQHHPPSAAIAGSSSAVEMVALLVQNGLFDCAVSVCQTFRLSLAPVFEGLAFKCIKLQFGGEEAQNEAWSWLADNQLSSVVNTKESSATDEAWRLLSSYLDAHPSTNAQYHRCVIHKLLSHGVPLPDWLVKSYKAVDAASLRLLLNFDLLDAAAELVLEYVDALLGRGHQYFGIERPLSATSSSVWLPYTSIDQLLQILNETQTNSSMYNKVRDKLEDYHKLVAQTTRSRLTAR
uniref:Nucleoporin 160 n=1 Tax=Tetraodon nigroviridis TaxID=99883 RepID=H3D8B1_TETNG